MKVLVTGGSGYIGRVMIESLLNRGDSVTILDNMLYGNHIDSWEQKPEVVVGDVTHEDSLQKAIARTDAVIHLAAIVGDQACDVDKDRAIHTNYLATRNIAHHCARTNKRMVFFSTCSVYGSKPGSVISERDTVLPLSIYAITKLAAEEAIQNSGSDYVILRLGTVYGYSPRMRFDLVINLMVAQALRRGKISVFGGEQFRPFVHVRDVVENALRVLDSRANGLFNLGGDNYRIREVAEKIRDATGCELNMFSEIKDPRNYAVDSTIAKQVWGARFSNNIEFAIDEIGIRFEDGNVKSFEDPLYNNAEWLRRLV